MTSFEWYQFVELRQLNGGDRPETSHLFFETPNALYFVDQATTTKIMKTTDEGVTVSTVETRTNGVQWAWYDRSGGKIYFVEQINGADFALGFFSLTLSDDSITEMSTLDHADDRFLCYDIFMIGASVFVLVSYYDDDVAQYSMRVYKWVDPNWVLRTSLDRAAACGTIFVSIVGSDAYGVEGDAVDGYHVYVYNDTVPSYTLKASIGAYSIGASWYQYATTYDGSDLISFIATAGGIDYFASYSIAGNSVTVGAPFGVSLMPDRCCIGTSGSPWEFEKAFHLTDPIVYQIRHSYVGLVKLQNIGLSGGETIVAISDKYLVTSNSDLYRYTESIIDLSTAQGIYSIYSPSVAQFSYHTSLSTDQLIEIYENASGTYTKCFSGRAGVPKYNSQNALYEFRCVNFGYDDLLRTVSKTVAAAGIDETVIALINDNCNYLYADATSVPNIATNITYTWEDQRLYDVLYTIAILANGYWWFEPNGYFYFRAYSNMPASGDTFSQATGDLGAPELRKLQNQFNTWIIDGGINSTTGKPFTKTETDDDHILLYGESVWNGREQFPEARTQADLDAIATGLKNWQGMQDNPDDAKSLVLGKYYYPVGYKASFQFTHLTEFATAQDMLISGVGINFKNKGMINVLFSTNITRGR